MRIALSLVTLLTSSALASSDWPSVQGPHGDRSVATGLDVAAFAQPHAVWRQATPSGFSSFVVAGDQVLTLIGREQGECCVALRASDGTQLWSRPLGGVKYDGGGDAGAEGNEGGDGPRSTPAVSGGRVYVYDSRMVLSCLDLESGEPQWTHDVRKDFAGREIKWQNASAPVIEGGLVLIAGGGEGRAMMGFDARSGELRWSHGDDEMTHATPTPTTIHGVRQVIFYLRAGLTSVAPETGEVLWSFPFDFRTSSAASPVVWQDLVYVSAGYGTGAGVWRIERGETGGFEAKNVWRERNDLMNHWSTPVCRDGYLYGLYGFKKYGDAPLQCVELKSGTLKWSVEGFGPGNLILAGDQLVVLSDAGEVVLAQADPEAYHELGRFEALGGKCWSSPALVGDQLYVRSTREGARWNLGQEAR